MTETKELEKRVIRGVKFLDEHYPGWLQEIDVDRLNLEHYSNCVLGQLYGDFGDGMYDLELSEEDIEFFGFFIPRHDPTVFKQAYERLTLAWKDMLNDLKQ